MLRIDMFVIALINRREIVGLRLIVLRIVRINNRFYIGLVI